MIYILIVSIIISIVAHLKLFKMHAEIVDKLRIERDSWRAKSIRADSRANSLSARLEAKTNTLKISQETNGDLIHMINQLESSKKTLIGELETEAIEVDTSVVDWLEPTGK